LLKSTYTLVNNGMSIYDKIRGRTPNPPRKPSSTDVTLNTMTMEGTGYTHPDRRFPNGANPKTADYQRGGIPIKSYKDWDPGPKGYKDAVPPLCTVCGNECTTWNTDSHGVWWCHFCSAKVTSTYGPQAMLPKDIGLHLLPALSDRSGKLVCGKCLTSMLPRADNMGHDCPCCHANYRNQPHPRPGPII